MPFLLRNFGRRPRIPSTDAQIPADTGDGPRCKSFQPMAQQRGRSTTESGNNSRCEACRHVMEAETWLFPQMHALININDGEALGLLLLLRRRISFESLARHLRRS